jgi:hypothetical protein
MGLTVTPDDASDDAVTFAVTCPVVRRWPRQASDVLDSTLASRHLR